MPTEQNNNSMAQPKKKVKKVLLLGTLFLMVILILAHFTWVASGSNQWKLVKDENGVKIYSLKSPGSRLIKLKAIRRVQSNLAGIVRVIEDTSSCADVGCREAKIIEKAELPSEYYSAYYSFKFDMPFPFDTRESVILIHHYQNPQSKEIEINVLAAPNKIHPDEGSVRIARLNNIYQITPLENGEVEIEFRQDFEMGGSVPYFFNNLVLPGVLYKNFTQLPELLSKEKFKNAKLDYIKEVNQEYLSLSNQHLN